MRAVVFLGPSLPTSEARQILDAVYLPPARQSDIVSAIGIHRPDVIGLVDGEFGQSLSVWHKEILYALEKGIPVFGASSMGALRAAETAAYGMVGIGEVYRMFASGELNDDDEVALAHGAEETGYRAVSEPMVNLRATFRQARDEGVVDDALYGRFVDLAKSLYFPERTFARIFRMAAEAGVPHDAIARMQEFAKHSYVDVKRRDTVELLETIRDLPASALRPTADFTLNRSHLFDTLYYRDRKVRHDGVDVPLAAIANWASLHRPDFNELNVHALNRALVGILADFLDVDVPEAEVDAEVRRFRLTRRLGDDEALQAWLDRNDLDAEEFRQLMVELATGRKLHRWLITRKFMERTVRIVLDELRLRGDYEEAASGAATQERVLAEHHQQFKETSYHDLTTPQLVVEHIRATSCRPDVHYTMWAEEAGYHSTEDLRVELLRAKLARDFTAGVTSQLMDVLTPMPPDDGPGAD